MSLAFVVCTALKMFPVSPKGAPGGGVQSGKLQGESHQMLEEIGPQSDAAQTSELCL